MGGYELLLIALVGIIVLGPEKMPKAIRSVYRFIRGVRQFADNVTSELDEELRIKELHRNLKQAEQQGFKNLSPEVQASVEELQRAAESVREGYKTPNTIAMPHMQNPAHQTDNTTTVAADADISQINNVGEQSQDNSTPSVQSPEVHENSIDPNGLSSDITVEKDTESLSTKDVPK